MAGPTTYHDAVRADAIADGSMVEVEIDGRPIAIANVRGQFFAFSGRCTHIGAPLARDGELVGMDLVCGWHGSCFSLPGGNVTAPPAEQPLAVYPVRLHDGMVRVGIAAEA